MLWNIVQNAGPIGFVLVGMSALALAVTVERLLFWLFCGGRIDVGQRAQLLELVRAGDANAVEILLAGQRNREAKALNRVFAVPESMRGKAGEVVLSQEVRATTQLLPILDLISAIAPMLGILGTVIGIVYAFGGMKGGNPDTAVMVAGLSVSMLTTAIGLVVALLSIVPYNILAGKAHRYQTQLAELIEECAIAAAAAPPRRAAMKQAGTDTHAAAAAKVTAANQPGEANAPC